MSERLAWYRAPEGWGSVRYEGDRILEIALPRRQAAPRRADPPPRGIAALTDRLGRYFDGALENVELPEGVSLDRRGIAGFRARVYRVVSKIPSGQTRSYGDVAAAAGNPGAARAVGRAMATNPFPIVVPCHRVVRSDGSIGGFAGAEALVGLKERMLGLERAEARG